MDAQGPAQVVSTDTIATKKGEACSEGIIGIVTGDSSISTAAKNGKITKITHVDYRAKNVLGVYAYYCTIVYGK